MVDPAFLLKSLIATSFDSIENVCYVKASDGSAQCMVPIKSVASQKPAV